MKFESLTERSDEGRSRRLALSGGAAVGLMGGLLAIAALLFGKEIRQQVMEPEVEVKLAKQERPAPPPPPPPPPPRAQPPKAAIKTVSKTPAALGNAEAPPKEMPKSPPKEGDVSRPLEATEHFDGRGDPNGVRGGTGHGGAASTPTAVPSATVETPPAPPTQTFETILAPVARHKPMPAYPEAARAQGIEAIVEVTFYVTSDGNVEDVRVLHGHPLFDEAVRRALLGWTFTPGSIDGKPARMRRHLKIPFRLRTQ